MNNLKKMLSLCVIAAFVTAISCNEDDPAGSCENGQFQMTRNGEPVTGVSFENTLGEYIKRGLPEKKNGDPRNGCERIDSEHSVYGSFKWRRRYNR